MNALLVVLQHSSVRIVESFLKRLGFAEELSESVEIRDHVHYDEHNIVDAEILIPGNLVVAIEAKIYQNMFREVEQMGRYFDLLIRKDEDRAMLLLISPDIKEPPAIQEFPGQDSTHLIKWVSWSHIQAWLMEFGRPSRNQPVEGYLISEFASYLQNLGLTDTGTGTDRNGDERLRPQLESILGNSTAEKVLLHIYHFGSAYGTQIARDHGLHLYGVQKQLDRFEKGGILSKERRGRTVLYSFIDANPFVDPLVRLIQHVYESIPLEEKSRIFTPRYRRRKG